VWHCSFSASGQHSLGNDTRIFIQLHLVKMIASSIEAGRGSTYREIFGTGVGGTRVVGSRHGMVERGRWMREETEEWPSTRQKGQKGQKALVIFWC
jgi:hypothetical protein